MLIIATKKSRTPCCTGCGKGKPCADKLRPRYTAQPSGLLLPDRRVIAPRSMLYGTPGELAGVRFSSRLPILAQFDMSCSPCCGGGTVEQCCCPDTLLPGTLTFEFTGCTGAAACLNGETYPLTYSGTGGTTDGAVWDAASAIGCGESFSVFQVRCLGDGFCGWQIFLAGCVNILEEPDSEVCDPFELSGSFTVGGGGGGTCVNPGDTVGWVVTG